MTDADRSSRPSRGLVGALFAAVFIVGGAGYWWTGSPGVPSAGPPGSAALSEANAGEQAAAANDPAIEQQFTALVEQLAEKMKAQPDNAQGWAMLARSYSRLQRFADAVPAYEKAAALSPRDADLLADYADALAMNNGRNLAGQPSALLDRALTIEPNHLKALALAGAGAFERKDYVAAVGHWEKLVQVAPADSGYVTQLQASIDEARTLGGLTKAPPWAAAASQPAAAAAAGATAKPAASAKATPVTSAAVQGSVRLSPALAQLAAPTDTVFIFARAAEGPRMPLAIVRHQVKDLPLDFKLDDSMAMAPAMRLSLHAKVVIGARISKSGQAAPAAGDLSGQSAAVVNDAKGVSIVIDEVLK